MRKTFALIFLAGAAVAQQEVADDTVVATLNGQKFTAAGIKALVAAAPSQVQAYFKKNPKQFLIDHAYYMQLLKYAEATKVDKKSPHKEALELQRLLYLAQAAMNEKLASISVTPEEQKSYYDTNQQQYRELRVRMIYFPFTDPSNEEPTKAKAAAVAKRAKAGEDFVKLAKASSDDPTGAGGDFAVRQNSTQPPAHMKEVLFKLKVGDTTEPLRHDNGYYVFRVESADVLPYDKVKDEIYRALQDSKFRQWQDDTRKQATVQFDNEAFFQSIGQQ
jgi:parvulin-like peptidyl-prolyl isomerase